MCINKVIEFTDFKSFYAKYKPLTPYGIDHKESMPFYDQIEELDAIHQATDILVDYINTSENKALKVENHLSRIDRLNPLDKSDYEVVDLHLIKKFLIHYKAIFSFLSEEIKHQIQLKNKLENILSALTPDNDLSDAFYLSSAFDPELKNVRVQIAALDDQLNQIRQNTLKEISDKYQIFFEGRDFVLINKNRTELLDVKELNCEFYDSHLIKVRPNFAKNYLDTQLVKEQLLIKEAELERAILSRLSNVINQHKEPLKEAIEKTGQLDVLMARARMAIKLQLVKPDYSASNMSVEEGIFYPLMEKHQAKQLAYTPLNASFESNTILLSGSNMGGKTVLFKTLAFLQLLTQAGFRVPAQNFKTKLYESIHILGTNTNNDVEGLSSFGHEIHQLTNVYKGHSKRLLFVDELAKTTNATEAKAILYAVLKYTTQNNQLTGFFSTHFINVPNIDGVSKYRMKGLNKEAYAAHCSQQSDDLNEKISLINTFMQYEITKDTGEATSNDALTIAGMLGLNEKILDSANAFINKRKENK